MRLYAAFIYVFLYAPIALIVVFSFNSGRYAMDWQGFSVEWYGRAFTNPVVTRAQVTSHIVAGSTAVIATVVGTLCALGLVRMRGWLRRVFDAHVYIS
ncbi:MAG: ABC transporter permease, partial [Parvibaculaceae bacterium]